MRALRPLAGMALVFLPLLAGVACGETTDRAEVRAQLADGCAINSDCNAPLVCAFRSCHIECTSSRDCTKNGPTSLCVQSEDGARVCQNEEEQTCVRHSECPGSQICGVDGHCRDACVDDRDCSATQKCVASSCAEPEELSADGQLPPQPDTGAVVSCTWSSDCPGDLVCLGNTCREECRGDKDCTGIVGGRCEKSRCVVPTQGQGGASGAAGTAGAGGAGASGTGGVGGDIVKGGDGGGAGVGDAGGPTIPGTKGGEGGEGGAGGFSSLGGSGGAGGDIVKGGDGGVSGSAGESAGVGGSGGAGGDIVKGGDGGTGGTAGTINGGSGGGGGTDQGGSGGFGNSGPIGGFGGSGSPETCACLDPNDECDANFQCVKKGIVCNAVTNCGTSYTCRGDGACACADDKVCGRGCRGGADCPSGLVCFPDTERCGLPHTPLRCIGNDSCKTGEACLDGVCKTLGKTAVGAACGKHSECASGVCGGVCLSTCELDTDCTNGLRCGPAKGLAGAMEQAHTWTQACMAQPPCPTCGVGTSCQYPGNCRLPPCATNADCSGSQVCTREGAAKGGGCEQWIQGCLPNEFAGGAALCALTQSCYLDDPSGCPAGYTCDRQIAQSFYGDFSNAPEQGLCARTP